MTSAKLTSKRDEQGKITYTLDIKEHADESHVCFAISTLVHTVSDMVERLESLINIKPGDVVISFTSHPDNVNEMIYARIIYTFACKMLTILEEGYPKNIKVIMP